MVLLEEEEEAEEGAEEEELRFTTEMNPTPMDLILNWTVTRIGRWILFLCTTVVGVPFQKTNHQWLRRVQWVARPLSLHRALLRRPH